MARLRGKNDLPHFGPEIWVGLGDSQQGVLPCLGGNQHSRTATSCDGLVQFGSHGVDLGDLDSFG